MRKELILAGVIYFFSMFTLLMAVYHFLEDWHMSEFNFFVAGALVLIVAVGWGYVLTAIIFAPQKQMEDTLEVLTRDIIHELNIPLSTITANTAMLKKTLIDERSRKRLQRIDDASHRLKKLYDGLVYAIHKEMHTIEKESFDIKKLIEERVAIFEEQNRNPFVLSLEPFIIEVDKIGFEQMLDNILTNAMKYSAKSSPIAITLKENILCIEDQGIGMSTGQLLRVHERYFQGDERKEGEGIGLALVKDYCDSEEIAIHITSEKDVGTVLRLHLHTMC